MRNAFRPAGCVGTALFLASLATAMPGLALAQPGSSDPPVNYEVQIDGESFTVEGGRPVKVESKLKAGTSYMLAVRVAMVQPLRLNSVQMEYGMVATVNDNKGKDLRIVKITHDLGFTLEITDLSQALDAKHRDEVLKSLTDALLKQYADQKATDLKQGPPKTQKFGPSDGKWLRITCNDAKSVARTCMIFVLWGEKYTISAVCEFKDQDKEDVGSWVMSALNSIRPLR